MTYGSGNSGNYKKLKGQNIQVLDTDPVVYAGTWATGGTLNVARKYLSGMGTQTAGMAVGGNAPGGAQIDLMLLVMELAQLLQEL